MAKISKKCEFTKNVIQIPLFALEKGIVFAKGSHFW